MAARPGRHLLLGGVRLLVFRRFRRRQPAAARPALRPAEPGRHSRQPRHRQRPLASARPSMRSRRIPCWSWSRRSTRGCARWSTAPSSRARSSGCRPRVEALANELIDAFPAGEPVDLLPAFASPLPITIIAEMLGVPVEMGPQLLDWSHQMVAMYMHGRTRETEEIAEPRGAGIFRFPARLCRRAAQEARRRSAVAADLRAGGRPEAHRGRAGFLDDPAAQRRARGDGAPDRQRGARRSWRRAATPGASSPSPEATAATVEECLRFDAPLHMFTRYAYDDIEVAPASPSNPASRSACCSAWPTAIRSAFAEPAAFRPGPHRPEERLVRRRHPFLHRRAAGAAGTAGGAEGAVRPAAASALWRSSRASATAGISMGWRGWWYAHEGSVNARFLRARSRGVCDDVMRVSEELAPFLALLPPARPDTGARLRRRSGQRGDDRCRLRCRPHRRIAGTGPARQPNALGRPVDVLLFENIEFCRRVRRRLGECMSSARAEAIPLGDPQQDPPSPARRRRVVCELQDEAPRKAIDQFGRYYNYPDEAFLRGALGRRLVIRRI